MSDFFTFSPRSEEELQSIKYLEKGDGHFEVVEANVKKSKNDNPMLELRLKAWDCNGKEGIIYDYLMTDMPDLEFKIRHFCESIRMLDKYEKGAFMPADCVGRSGKLRIGFKDKAIKKNPDGTTKEFSARNVVYDYLPDSHPKTENAPNKNGVEIKDDDIPW